VPVAGKPSLSRGAWAAGVLIAAAALAFLQWGPERIARWRADRTAAGFVSALHRADSAALAGFTPTGRTTGILCARRHWPAAYWARGAGEPALERLSDGLGDFRYRVAGDSLPDHAGPATFEFYILPGRPTKVDRYFADARVAAWSDRFRTCVRGE